MAADFDADAAARDVTPFETIAWELYQRIAEHLRVLLPFANLAVSKAIGEALAKAQRETWRAALALVEREQRAHAAQAQQHAASPRAVEYQSRAEALGAVAAMLRAEVERG